MPGINQRPARHPGRVIRFHQNMAAHRSPAVRTAENILHLCLRRGIEGFPDLQHIGKLHFLLQQHLAFPFPNGALQMQLKGDPNATIGLGSITYITKTANGFIALDGNMRDVVLWPSDGTWLGSVDTDDLFSADYPWLASADVMDDGSILCIMTTERLDKSADELVAFRISGF